MTPRDATKEPCSLAELFASWGPVQLINPHEPRAFTKLAARYADLLQLIHRLEARCAPSAIAPSVQAAQGTPEDKRDAARYRWAIQQEPDVLFDIYMDLLAGATPEQWTAAIDAAMNTKTPEGE